MENLAQPTTPRSWEQQPNENAKSFGAFGCYLGLGARRSLNLCAAECGISHETAERWSRKYKWQSRIAAWNAYRLQLQIEKVEEVTTQSAASWVKRAAALREREWAVGNEGVELARQIIQKLLHGRKRKMTIQDAARLLEVCSKIGRQVAVLASERVDFTGQNGEPIRVARGGTN